MWFLVIGMTILNGAGHIASQVIELPISQRSWWKGVFALPFLGVKLRNYHIFLLSMEKTVLNVSIFWNKFCCGICSQDYDM